MNTSRNETSSPPQQPATSRQTEQHPANVVENDQRESMPPRTNRWFTALVAVCGVFILTTLIYLVSVFQRDAPQCVQLLAEHFLVIVGVLTAITLLCATLGLREDRRAAWAEYEARVRQWHQRLQAAHSAVAGPQQPQARRDGHDVATERSGAERSEASCGADTPSDHAAGESRKPPDGLDG